MPGFLVPNKPKFSGAQPTGAMGDVRVAGDATKQEKVVDVRSGGASGDDRMYGPTKDQSDNRLSKANDAAGYIGSVDALVRNDDTRHPSGKQWVKKSRKPLDYQHTNDAGVF